MSEEEADSFLEDGRLMRLLLDTMTFVWAASSPERVSRAAMAALASERAFREISAISLAELTVESARGKLTFPKEDVMQGLAELQARVLPYTAEHAYALFDLRQKQADLFDRQILAQALGEGIAVVTPDEAFRLHEGLKIVW